MHMTIGGDQYSDTFCNRSTYVALLDRLMDEGVFAQPVVFPTVALDQSRDPDDRHGRPRREQLDRALEAFSTVGRELGVIGG